MAGSHSDLHSEQGAVRGDHPGRAANPVIKIRDIAWLEFDKPDLVRAEAFARAFGFQTSSRGPDELHLRGTDSGAPCVLLRRGDRSRFTGIAFRAADEADVRRLAAKTGSTVQPLPDDVGGSEVRLVDPSGIPVRVVAGVHDLPQLPTQTPLVVNAGHDVIRANATQRPPRAPARVQRLGHVVLQSTKYVAALNWYLENLGMIVSDFLFFPASASVGQP